jgi:hypothetical protein
VLAFLHSEKWQVTKLFSAHNIRANYGLDDLVASCSVLMRHFCMVRDTSITRSLDDVLSSDELVHCIDLPAVRPITSLA